MTKANLAHCDSYAPLRELGELFLKLRPHKENVLVPSLPTRPRPAEWIKDQFTFPCGGHQRPAHQAQGLLGRMVAVEFLTLGDSGDTPDRRHLDCGIWAVYEVVVEGVFLALAGLKKCLVGMSEGCV